MTKGKRKTERAELKKTRKEAFGKFLEAIRAAKDVNLDDSMNYQDKFEEVWPVIQPALEFAKALRITRERIDNIITEIISLGEKMADNYTENDRTELTKKLSGIWNKVERALGIAQLFANDKQDKVIDKIIEIGDWILDDEN